MVAQRDHFHSVIEWNHFIMEVKVTPLDHHTMQLSIFPLWFKFIHNSGPWWTNPPSSGYDNQAVTNLMCATSYQ